MSTATANQPGSQSGVKSGTAGSNPMDTKREEFRKYLEKEGILEALTKALVNIPSR